MTEADIKSCKEFVADLCARGCYTKYAATKEVMVEYGLTYEQAYYRVRRYWTK